MLCQHSLEMLLETIDAEIVVNLKVISKFDFDKIHNF